MITASSVLFHLDVQVSRYGQFIKANFVLFENVLDIPIELFVNR